MSLDIHSPDGAFLCKLLWLCDLKFSAVPDLGFVYLAGARFDDINPARGGAGFVICS